VDHDQLPANLELRAYRSGSCFTHNVKCIAERGSPAYVSPVIYTLPSAIYLGTLHRHACHGGVLRAYQIHMANRLTYRRQECGLNGEKTIHAACAMEISLAIPRHLPAVNDTQWVDVCTERTYR
jgi:hypothetical protein